MIEGSELQGVHVAIEFLTRKSITFIGFKGRDIKEQIATKIGLMLLANRLL